MGCIVRGMRGEIPERVNGTGRLWGKAKRTQ
jgi:hypothetical protein